MSSVRETIQENAPLQADSSFKLYQCTECELQFWDPLKNPGSRWGPVPILVEKGMAYSPESH